MNKIYVFFYNSCIHESAPYPVSLHKSLKGAYDAMRKDKVNNYLLWYEERMVYGKRRYRYADKHALHEDWYVGQREILD